MKTIITVLILSISAATIAQDSIINKSKQINFSGYIESYYSYDFAKPANNTRPAFLYNYNRHNEININLAMVKLNYNGERFRSNLALAAGTYVQANYAQEEALLKNLFEANIGLKLSGKKNFWLDIGIMPSHIGFESAIGKDNWTLTRSILAENSPYFETGARLSYTTDNRKLSISALALNGWQRINRINGNSLMSWGTQLYYNPNQKLILNYSTFIGTDKPDSARLWRVYHNVYGIYQVTEKFGLTLGVDIGQEQKSKKSKNKNTWYSPIAIARMSINKHWTTAVRAEYFKDKNAVIIATGTPNGFNTVGWSANLDYLPINNLLLRIEFRNLTSKDAYFNYDDGSIRKQNNALSFSASIGF